MERINRIVPPDSAAYFAAKNRWDSIAKPLGSFGRLEEMLQKIAAVQGTPEIGISRRCAVVFCADHGIVAEGVTQCGSEVTAICANAIAAGTSNVNAVAAAVSAETLAVDVGMKTDIDAPHLMNRKVAYGTRNFTHKPAMTEQEVTAAVTVGMETARLMRDKGVNIIVSGEMGIGNTTAASAIAAVLLGQPPEAVTGRGAGLSSEWLARKIAVIRRGITLHRPSPDRPLHLMQTLGGLELAAMTGLFLGGAYYHIPVVIDGMISAAAAAVAYKMQPLTAEYMLASHCSGEPAASGLLAMMGFSPVIDAGLRLGEGTGGLLLLPLLDGAYAIYRSAHRFADENMEGYKELI